MSAPDLGQAEMPSLPVVPDAPGAAQQTTQFEPSGVGQMKPGETRRLTILKPAVVKYRQPVPVRRVLAPWITDSRERAAALKWAYAHYSRLVAWHAVRTPLYGWRLTKASCRGAVRLGISWLRWVLDREAAPLRATAVAEGRHAAYLALVRQRDQRVKSRLALSGGFAAAAITATATAASRWQVPPIVVLFVAFVVLGVVGQRKDKPVVESAVIAAPGAQRFTNDAVMRAFRVAKLCTEAEPITFLPPGVFRDGEGWGAVIDLPYGGKASAALKKVEDVAAALDVDEVRLSLSRVRGDSGSARRLEFWLADRDPFALRPPASPLLELDRVDFWKGIPFGVDARRRPISLDLVWSSLLIGAMPRMGKTFAARGVVAAAALDPHVRLIIADGKGGKDWSGFREVAHWIGSGVRTAVVESLVRVLRKAVDDMNRRYEVLESLPDDVCPEGKLTPSLARDRELDMPLTMIVLDEVHRYLEHEVHGGEICELLTELIRTGPAAGYMLLLATQKPDAKAIPSKLRDLTGTRFALKAMTWQASEAVLGAGTHGDGLDASRFLRAHKGVGWLLGADDSALADEGARIVRTYLLDVFALAGLLLRARELRLAEGTLSGAAAGKEVITEQEVTHLIRDVLSVFNDGEDRLWSETICTRLGELKPGAYSGWDAVQLGTSLKAYGVETKQLSLVDQANPERGRRNKKGARREDLEKALAGL